jgi:hypothetical protein
LYLWLPNETELSGGSEPDISSGKKLLTTFPVRSMLFRVVMQRGVVNFYRPSRTTYPSQLGFLTLEDGTDILSRNVGKELPLNAA